MTNELATRESGFISPAASVPIALERYQAMKDFIEKVLKKDHDFGVIPGSEKPALLKPGAEKLASFFGLSPAFISLDSTEDWTGENHGGEMFFFYRYKVQLVKNGIVAGEGIGSCNSWEKKYRYRNAQRVCPKCHKETIIKGKDEYGGGYICFAKKGGCGAKFSDNDEQIINQEVGQVKNPDIADIVNTLDKMAQKRALIAATLIATNASDYFTQDIEDFIDAEFNEKAYSISEPVVPLDNIPEMSLEMARSEKSSDGRTYGEIADAEPNKLGFMFAAIQKREPSEENKRKMTAIQTILKNQ